MKLFLRLPEKIRFLFCGGFNTVAGYLLFVLLYLVLKNTLPYQIILFIATFLGTIISFTSFKLLVFQNDGSWKHQYCKTLVSYLMLYFLNIIMLYFLIEVFNLSVLFGEAIVIIILAICSYILHKHFSFKSA